MLTSPCAPCDFYLAGDFGLSREMTADLPIAASAANNLADLSATDNRSPPASLALTTAEQHRRGHNDKRERLTSVTKGVGTTLYMSPEQRAGREYDHKVGWKSVSKSVGSR